MFDEFPYRQGELYCEDVPIRWLAEQFGTPLWVYSQAHLLRRLRELQQAFAGVNPVICYSVKANSNLTLLRLMAAAGASFDIVSGGELYRVLAAGADPSRVVFAGVGKTDDEIRQALRAQILMFDVESEAELDNLARLAAEMNTIAPVALRLNPDVDPHTHVKTTTGKRGNKFGMDIERFQHLAHKVLQNQRLRLIGIHMHLGSPILSPQPYAQALTKALPLMEQLRRAGHDLRWINLGGGFGISYRRHEGPPASAYAEVIVPAIQQSGCQLALEPGRFIVGNAAILVTRVLYIKHEGGKQFVIQDGAMNDLLRPTLYEAFHRIWPVVSTQPFPDDPEAELPGCQKVDVVGPVCESGDYFAKDRWLPPLQRGDCLAVFSAGAYGFAMSSQYNSRPRGAEVLISGREIQLIRQRETYEDLIRHEQFLPGSPLRWQYVG